MNPPTIHWHWTGRIGCCLGYGALPPKGAPRFGLKRSFQSLLLDGNWNPGQKFSILFCLALPGPKHHQTNRARNFCTLSRTTVARFRHMAQGPPLHWLRPDEKAVVCSLTAPWSTVPDAPQHSQPSHVLVARLCTTESSRIFLSSPSTPIQHIPTSTFGLVLLPQTSRVSKFPSEQTVPMHQ